MTGPKQPPDSPLDEVIESYDRLLRVLATARSPEFLETNLTMAQMKVLMVLTSGELSMSAMAAQLGVSLSTVTGLVDRLVEAGYAARREGVDRRHVIVSLTPAGGAFIDRFQDLGVRRLRELLSRLDEADLRQIRRSIDLLTEAAEKGPLGIAEAEPVAVVGERA